MSELRKYQRSKQVLLEMIDRVTQGNLLEAFRSDKTKYVKIHKDLEELHQLVADIDCKLAKLSHDTHSYSA